MRKFIKVFLIVGMTFNMMTPQTMYANTFEETMQNDSEFNGYTSEDLSISSQTIVKEDEHQYVYFNPKNDEKGIEQIYFEYVTPEGELYTIQGMKDEKEGYYAKLPTFHLEGEYLLHMLQIKYQDGTFEAILDTNHYGEAGDLDLGNAYFTVMSTSLDSETMYVQPDDLTIERVDVLTPVVGPNDTFKVQFTLNNPNDHHVRSGYLYTSVGAIFLYCDALSNQLVECTRVISPYDDPEIVNLTGLFVYTPNTSYFFDLKDYNFTIAGTTPDHTKPVFHGITRDKDYIETDDTLTYTLHVEDDLSGIERAEIE